MKRLINFTRVTAPGSGNGNRFCRLGRIRAAFARSEGSGARVWVLGSPGAICPRDISAVSEHFKQTGVVMTLLPSFLPFHLLSLWFFFSFRSVFYYFPFALVFILTALVKHQKTLPLAKAIAGQKSSWNTNGRRRLRSAGERTRRASGWGRASPSGEVLVSAQLKDKAMALRFRAGLESLGW